MRAWLVLATLLAGCAGLDGEAARPPSPSRPPGAPSAEECAELMARPPSGNAPRLPLFRGDPAALAAATADALRDPLRSAEPSASLGEGQVVRWLTRDGWIDATRGLDGNVTLVRYGSDALWISPASPEAGEEVLRIAAALGAPNGTLAEPEIRPSAEGGQRTLLAGVGQSRLPGGESLDAGPFRGPGVDLVVADGRPEPPRSRSLVTIRPMHDLARAVPAATPAEAREAATLAVACALVEADRAEDAPDATFSGADAPLTVVRDSLAYSFTTRYVAPGEPDACRAQRSASAQVDAVTLAPLAVDLGQLGCRT